MALETPLVSREIELDYDGTMKALPPQFQQNFKGLETRYAEAVLEEVSSEDAKTVARYLISLKWVAGLAQSREAFLRNQQAQNPSGLVNALTNRAATYDGLATALESLTGVDALDEAGGGVAISLREIGEVDRKVVSDMRLSVLDKMREERETAYQQAATHLNEAVRGLVEAASEFYAPGIVQSLLTATE